jgi:hypothetical protein
MAFVRCTIFIVSGLVASGVALAGGDYASGHISSLSGKNGSYSFKFSQLAGGPELVAGCPSFNVLVEFSRVPWYSWLPWVKGLHPTLDETNSAAEFLRTAELENRPIRFGYMGSGLIESDRHCVFGSKGLQLFNDGVTAVLSYHDPV